jgi:PhnB protein
MKVINPYLTFRGNCEEAFTFYKSVFGGEFSYVGRFSEMPPEERAEISESDQNKIMHISLPISKETILMGSDEFNSQADIGNNISLSLTTDTKEDADRIFEQLSAGGQANMPMNDTFWGDYFGMCTDRFNINWMVSYNEKWAEEHADSSYALESQTTAG